jgi:ribosome-binding protein aMBF1 (putative translation factor)
MSHATDVKSLPSVGVGCENTTMLASKRKKLESRGWKVADASDFLNLSAAEDEYIALRLKLAEGLRGHRAYKNLSQAQLAKCVKSSQSRIAKMEAGDASVSLDLIVKSLLALGASHKDLAQMIGRSPSR